MRDLSNAQAIHLASLAAAPFCTQDKTLKHLSLEYCSGGYLNNEISRRFHSQNGRAWVSEKNLWRTFYCLAQGLMAMGHSVETLNQLDAPDWDPVVHLDLKVFQKSTST